ncbi:MAG: sugar phosphate nucleotidyltransferase, partial [bacterium]|nr:sugar phosphate nucleotidyltransferase [bacterium]
PSTALGYLKETERQDEIDGIELYGFGGQIEKPTYEVAKELLESGDYLWNGNYLTWTPVKFLEAFDAYAPEMGVSLRNIQKLLAEGNREEAVSVFEAMEPISLDYAIGEKFNHDEVAILKGDFGWSDVGAWDTLYARLAEDRNESNIVRGESIVIDSSGNLVHTDSKKLVALVGVENIVVIDTEDALLVTTHSYAQRVKEVIEELKSRKSEHLL